MFYINVWLTVKDEQDIGEIADLLAEACRLSREEPGCEGFEVFHSETDATRFLLCEQWESKAAWEAHRGEKAFREIYEPQVLPRVHRDPHISKRLVE